MVSFTLDQLLRRGEIMEYGHPTLALVTFPKQDKGASSHLRQNSTHGDKETRKFQDVNIAMENDR